MLNDAFMHEGTMQEKGWRNRKLKAPAQQRHQRIRETQRDPKTGQHGTWGELAKKPLTPITAGFPFHGQHSPKQNLCVGRWLVTGCGHPVLPKQMQEKKKANRERYEQKISSWTAQDTELWICWQPESLSSPLAYADVFVKVLGTAHYNSIKVFDRALLFTAEKEH